MLLISLFISSLYSIQIIKEGATSTTCNEPCSECLEDNPNYCVSCKSGYGLLVGENNEKTGECRSCPAFCSSTGCSEDSNNCTQCNSNYGPIIDENGYPTGKCAPCLRSSPCSNNYLYGDKDGTSYYSEGPVFDKNDKKTRFYYRCMHEYCLSCSENYEKCDSNEDSFYKEYGPAKDKNGNYNGDIGYCPDHCNKCTEDRFTCTECDSGFVLSETGLCLACPSHCSECEIDSNGKTQCTQSSSKISSYTKRYKPRYENKKSTGVVNNTKYSKCIDENCIDSTEYDSKSNTCGDNCEKCPDGPEICNTCNNGYGLVIGNNGVPGPNCKECKEGCQECSDDSENCRVCLPGFGFKLNDKGYQTGECEKCSENCEACDYDSSRCLKCLYGYGFIRNEDGKSTGKCGKCPLNCENCMTDNSWCIDCLLGYGFKVDNDGKITNTCEKCPENCYECRLSNNCEDCSFFYGFARDSNNPSTMKCEKCLDNNCRECKEEHSYCTDCKGTYTLDTEGKCKACPNYCYRCDKSVCDSCIAGFSFYTDENGIKSNECKKCPENCYECSNSTTCTDCYDNYYLINNTCVFPFVEHCLKYYSGGCTKCEPGYEIIGGECKECPNGDCSSYNCDEGYSMSYHGSTYGKCLPCSKGCLKCNVDANECLECNEEYSFMRDGDFTSNECVKCPSYCQYCDENNKCLSCLEFGAGFVIQNGVNTGKCSPCADKNCGFCPYDYTICFECEDGAHMDNDKSSSTYGKCILNHNKIPGCEVENCHICAYEDPIQCRLCNDGYCIVDDGLYKKCAPCQTKCNVENCQRCISGHSDQCELCNDGLCVNEDATSSNYKKCVSCNVPCQVENCKICVSGSSDRCKECKYGFVVSVSGTCVKPTDEIEREKYDPEYIEIDTNKVHDGIFEFEGSDYQKPENKDLSIKLDSNNNINTVIINTDKDLTIETNRENAEITLQLKDDNSVKQFDIYTSGDYNIIINLDGRTHASIKNGQGEIEIKGTENTQKVNLNQVEPSNKDFTLIPTVPVEIDVVDFNKNQGLIVKSKESSAVKVKTLKVQQKAEAIIQNATITESIIFGIASSLEINEFVNLSLSLLNFSFNPNSEESKKAPLNGVLKSVPSAIRVTNRQVGELSQERILIAESKLSLDCDKWTEVSKIEATDTSLNDFECKSEDNVFRLYAYKNPSKGGDDGDKGNKLKPAEIAGIVIGVVVAVGIVVFLLVYFLVIKKKKNNDPSEQEAGDEKADEV